MAGLITVGGADPVRTAAAAVELARESAEKLPTLLVTCTNPVWLATAMGIPSVGELVETADTRLSVNAVLPHPASIELTRIWLDAATSAEHVTGVLAAGPPVHLGALVDLAERTSSFTVLGSQASRVVVVLPSMDATVALLDDLEAARWVCATSGESGDVAGLHNLAELQRNLAHATHLHVASATEPPSAHAAASLRLHGWNVRELTSSEHAPDFGTILAELDSDPVAPTVTRLGADLRWVLPLELSEHAPLSVSRRSREMAIEVDGHRKVFGLPAVLERSNITSAKVDHGDLVVEFTPNPEHGFVSRGTPMDTHKRRTDQ